MQQPLGFVYTKKSHIVYKFHKALYGLKQVPRARFEKFIATLYAFGFVFTRLDQYLFMRITSRHITYILVYVDDILVTESDV